MVHWRESVNPEIKAHFERLVTKSAQHKEAYEQSKQGAIAQLWTANAIQEKELDELREKIALLEKAIGILAEKGRIGEQAAMKTKFLEKALAEISGKRPEEEKIDANKAMREVISRKAVVKEIKEEQKAKETEAEPETYNSESKTCRFEDEDKILCRHEDLKKEPGWLYFISKEGNLARVPMSRGAENEKFKQEILHECKIQREPEWLYYVDKHMNAARANRDRKTSEDKKESPRALKKVLKNL